MMHKAQSLPTLPSTPSNSNLVSPRYYIYDHIKHIIIHSDMCCFPRSYVPPTATPVVDKSRIVGMGSSASSGPIVDKSRIQGISSSGQVYQATVYIML